MNLFKPFHYAVKKVARHPAVVVFALPIFAFLLAEITLSHFPLPAYVTDFIYRQGADLRLHQASSDVRRLVELKPNSTEVYYTPGKPERVVTINALGLRDAERTVRKEPGIVRIIVLGGSTTYGAAVSDWETLPCVMERLLNRERGNISYEVWNAGVSAYSPQSMTALAEKLIQRGGDPDVVLFQISLLGPRAFLNGAINLAAYREDPSLFGEHFVLPPKWPYSPTVFLAARSRLFLLLIAHYNRMIPEKDRDSLKKQFCIPHHAAAMAAFMEKYGGRIKIAAFVAPGAPDEDLKNIREITTSVGMPLWLILPPNADKAYSLFHPPTYVHEYWARVLADRMRDEKFIEESPVKSNDAKTEAR